MEENAVADKWRDDGGRMMMVEKDAGGGRMERSWRKLMEVER